jgi:hypothetical protein
MGCMSDFLFSLPLDLLNSLLWEFLSIPTPYRLLCYPQSQTLVTTSILDLLWLPEQSGCVRVYRVCIPDQTSPAR